MLSPDKQIYNGELERKTYLQHKGTLWIYLRRGIIQFNLFFGKFNILKLDKGERNLMTIYLSMLSEMGRRRKLKRDQITRVHSHEYHKLKSSLTA